jgi:hypothetical protein
MWFTRNLSGAPKVIRTWKTVDWAGVSEDDNIPAHKYEVKVEVDSGGGYVEKTMCKPYTTTGADYYVNWASGTITFLASQTGNTVRVSYSKANTSGFLLAPNAGKILQIRNVIVRFSDDFGMTDTIVFQVRGYVESFAPTYWDQVAKVGRIGYTATVAGVKKWIEIAEGTSLPGSGTAGQFFYETTTPKLYQHDGDDWVAVTAGPYPGGTQIDLVNTEYADEEQVLSEAIEFDGPVPASTAGTARNRSKGWTRARFPYETIRTLEASKGMDICIMLESDTVFTGEHASATFYCVSEPEAI